jgi:phosphate-selective porin
MSKKHLLMMVLALLPFFQINTFAQDDIDKRVKDLENKVKDASQLKLSGYGQFEYRNIEKSYSVSPYPASQNEFRVRRGRLKAEYKTDLLGAVIQIDATQGGLSIKDAYLDFRMPFANFVTLRGGLTKVVVGHEILQSSSDRYAPERARVATTLVPSERDVAALLTIQGPKNHILNPFTLNLQLVNGAGIANGYANTKNFVARLSYANTFGDFKLGIGASTYQGGAYQPTSKVFTMDGSKFTVDDNADNVGQYASRTYYEGDLTLTYKSSAGSTFLAGEFWGGEQPGTSSSSTSFGAAPTTDIYVRPFSGIIAQLGHQITNTGLTVAVKYDIYNPNTAVSGDEIGATDSYTTAGDIAYNTFGAGLIYEPVKNLRFTLWYDMITNETSNALSGYQEDKKDNILTLRMQVKF